MKKNTWVTILFGSILLNVFLLGMAVPHLVGFHGFPGQHGGPINPLNRMRDATDTLDQVNRDKVLAILDAHSASIDHDMQQMHQSFDHLPELLTAPDLNTDQFRAEDKALAARDAQLHGEISDMIAEIAAQLPTDQRIKFFRAAMPPHHGGGMPH